MFLIYCQLNFNPYILFSIELSYIDLCLSPSLGMIGGRIETEGTAWDRCWRGTQLYYTGAWEKTVEMSLDREANGPLSVIAEESLTLLVIHLRGFT